MHSFDYERATELPAVLSLLAERRGQARVLAGGTDLIVNMRVGRRQPELVIDVKKVPELNELCLDEHGLLIGASVSCRRIWEHQQIRELYPALIDSTTLVGSVQIQGRASLGGNLCNAAPSGDGIPTLIAYGAVAQISSVDGSRELPVEDVCIGPGKTALQAHEVLVSLRIPRPAPRSGVRFLRFIPRNEMDIAEANVAVAVTLSEDDRSFESVRVAIGAVGPTPIFVGSAGEHLSGASLTDDNIMVAASLAENAARPIDDMRGTAKHRRKLIRVLTERAIRGAIERAGGECQ